MSDTLPLSDPAFSEVDSSDLTDRTGASKECIHDFTFWVHAQLLMVLFQAASLRSRSTSVSLCLT